MRRLLLLIFTTLTLISCGGSKQAVSDRDRTPAKEYGKAGDKRINSIVDNALTYEGVPYKWGGTTRKGMDCSGLVYTAFQSEQIQLPRVSRNMALEGMAVRNQDITIGDLLFFKTEGSRNVNHVGLVVDLNPREVLFIHTTVSLGVIISSLDERYWAKSYSGARRIR